MDKVLPGGSKRGRGRRGRCGRQHSKGKYHLVANAPNPPWLCDDDVHLAFGRGREVAKPLCDGRAEIDRDDDVSPTNRSLICPEIPLNTRGQWPSASRQGAEEKRDGERTQPTTTRFELSEDVVDFGEEQIRVS